MFLIGDKVVYPMQGIGTIERIENKVFSGKNVEYTIIRIISKNLEIMIPTEKLSNSNLRKICDNSMLEKVLVNLSKKEDDSENISSKERYQNNMSKVKTGSFKDSAEAVYDLVLMNKTKSLNSSEKQLYSTAHKFLVEEVSMIKNISEIEATDYLNLNLN